jgi:hypothetical protein
MSDLYYSTINVILNLVLCAILFFFAARQGEGGGREAGRPAEWLNKLGNRLRSLIK